MTIGERIKIVRKELGQNQRDFAKSIDISQPALAMLENGQREVKNRHISLICIKHGISEEWLRYGIEPMKKPVEDEIAECVEDLLSTENPFYDLIKGIMKTYKKLDDKSQEVLTAFSEELLKEMKKDK
ncbi:MAG: helix-turn-helix domain-containing protein [Lachnospiraceae bacterium]|nr:helix-turn-helix domain-containing protein [Lachnospiraceae bacterium]